MYCRLFHCSDWQNWLWDKMTANQSSATMECSLSGSPIMLQVMLNSSSTLHKRRKERKSSGWSKIGLAIGETEAHKSPNVPGDKDDTEEEI